MTLNGAPECADCAISRGCPDSERTCPASCDHEDMDYRGCVDHPPDGLVIHVACMDCDYTGTVVIRSTDVNW